MVTPAEPAARTRPRRPLHVFTAIVEVIPDDGCDRHIATARSRVSADWDYIQSLDIVTDVTGGLRGSMCPSPEFQLCIVRHAHIFSL